MKRLFAVLTACAMMTGAFVSCGKEEKEESSESEKDVSVSDSAEDDKSSEAEAEISETADSENEDSETLTVETETESITGMWLVDGEDYGFSAYENGKGSFVLDVSEIVHITSDGGLYLSGENIDAENVIYEGGLLTVLMDGSEMLLEKNDSDFDSMDGRYYIIDVGNFNDANLMGVISAMGIESPDPVVYIDGNSLYLEFENMFTYTAENGSITISEDFDAINLYKDSVITYEFTDNDHVNIVIDGFERTMTRADFC